ncbi:MAG: protein kinase domain-containing protein [Pyrinomonadaceae bacterium]
MNLDSLIGQTLDEKYKIESELGRGGMGAVYLSTHVGTERHVAVKVIVPEFMRRAEFVERFRREARAAGRLRHPNVVDVTDFGIADTPDGRVAYLVMEYLDGCTLGEILDEEKRLPLRWTLDILEQVSSAIHEAHRQGIIHRDLKPDNIWLEPNQRGGYTVKVLDFGIAKLEAAPNDVHNHHTNASLPSAGANQTQSFQSNSTVSDESRARTIPANRRGSETVMGEKGTIAETNNSKTSAAEAGTLIQPQAKVEEAKFDSEAGTAIMQPAVQETSAKAESEAGTRVISEQFETGKQSPEKKNTAELTRVGAVLGTPLYMSPEQCRGEKLTAKSDIYSLGVIAYRMLSGKTPFDGDYLEVMKAHKETPPPALTAKKIPKKVKRSVSLALEKNPDDRPATVEAFANNLRANSEGIGSLFQRAMIIYSQHLPKFLKLALIFYFPLLLLTILQVAVSFLMQDELVSAVIKGSIALATMFFSFVCGSLIVGTSTWLVAQILAYPLKPVTLRPALNVVRTKWKKLAGTSLLLGVLEIIGFAFCIVPGVLLNIFWALASAVVMMENLHGFAALKRSKNLVKRSFRTTFALTLISFFVPVIISLSLAYFTKLAVQDISSKAAAISEATKSDADKTKKTGSSATPAPTEIANEQKTEPEKNINISISTDKQVSIENTADKKDPNRRLKSAFSEALQQIIFLPISILLISFFTIVGALLYFKSRQAGGESMQELLAQFEEADRKQSKWQQRVRARLEQSGRTTGKN